MKKTIIIFCLGMCVTAVFTKKYISGSGNEATRIALVESLVERHTFCIEKAKIDTPDKVLIKGHYYCDKPLVFPVLSSAVYFILYNVFNLSFSKNPQIAVYLFTVFTVGIAYAILLVFFYKALSLTDISEYYKYLLTASLGLATLIFSYSVTYNNHVVAGAFAFMGFYYLLTSQYFLSGLFSALAFSTDIPNGSLLLAGFFIFSLLSKRWKNFFTGACIPVIFWLILNLIMIGDIRPAYLYPGAYEFPGSTHTSSAAGLYRPADVLGYAFHSLLGARGLFSYTPLLILPIIAMLGIFRNKKHRFYKEAVIIIWVCVMSVLFHTLMTGDYGGWSYGFRFYIAIVPVLFFFAVFYFEKNISLSKRVFFYVLLCTSLLTAVVGAYNPWTVCHKGRTFHAIGDEVKSTFCGNLACMLAEKSIFPSGLRRCCISKDDFKAYRYMGLAYLNMRKNKKAGEMFEKALKIKPDDRATRYFLSFTKIRQD
ncbi:MAG: hypothetical protein JW983_03500 [Elusimicrobia bacterium]|nr:hypothetical protein [Elusimicrobiota bacterium]